MNLKIFNLQYSIRGKLLLAILLVSVLFTSLTAPLIFYFAQITLTNQKREALFESTLEQSHENARIFLSSRDLVYSLSRSPLVSNYLLSGSADAGAVLDLFRTFHLEESYSIIYLLDKNGNAVVSTDRSLIGSNYAFRGYFRDAFLGKEGVEASVGVTTKKLGFYFSAPVYTEEKVLLGVVVVKANPEPINKSIEESLSAKGGHIYLTDENGLVISSDVPDRIYKTLGRIDDATLGKIREERRFEGIEISSLTYDPVQNFVRHYDGPKSLTFFDAEDNETEILSVAKVGYFPYYLVSEHGTSSINQSALGASLILVFSVISIVFSSLLLVFIILNSFLRPVGLLKEFAKRLSKGDFKKPVVLSSRDEFQDLSLSLNEMAEKLKNYYRDLEREVVLRTNEAKKAVEEVNLKNRDLDETKTALLNVLSDVDAEKSRAELALLDLQKFKLAVENADEHIVITDPDGKILYANKAVELITGFNHKSVIGARPSLWGKQMDKDFYVKFWKTIKTDKKEFKGEIKNKRKNGEIYTADVRISPILGFPNGEVQFFVGIERDITEAKEIDRMKTEFISLTSHQLRTPLGSIRWLGEMLLKGDFGKLSEKQQEIIQAMYDSSSRLVDLVSALLNISRIESGRLIIEPVPTILTKLVDEILGDLKTKLEEKKHKIGTNYQSDLSEANIDPNLIRQVYLNLLTNAIKYTPEGGAIGIDIRSAGKEIISSISDNGYGIPDNQRSRVFSRFFRGENIVKIEPDGTGLGLYLVKAIVETSGGKIWFESSAGKGTTFTFSLPIEGVPPKKGEVRLDNMIT